MGAVRGERLTRHVIVLVERESDRVAIETLAARTGRDLAADGVRIVSMDGATNVGSFLRRFDAEQPNARVAALCDAGVEKVIAEAGELQSLRILQAQPAQRGRAPESQLRRFIGTRSGRKRRYARLLVESLDLTRVPTPLEQLLALL